MSCSWIRARPPRTDTDFSSASRLATAGANGIGGVTPAAEMALTSALNASERRMRARSCATEWGSAVSGSTVRAGKGDAAVRNRG